MDKWPIQIHTHTPLFSSSNLLKNMLFTRQKTQSGSLHLVPILQASQHPHLSPSNCSSSNEAKPTPLPPEPGFSHVNCSGRYCFGARSDRMPAPWLTCLHAHSCHFHHCGENDLLKLACWCSEKNEKPRKNRPSYGAPDKSPSTSRGMKEPTTNRAPLQRPEQTTIPKVL